MVNKSRLMELLGEWRAPSYGIISREMDVAPNIERFYDSSRLQCADELSAAIKSDVEPLVEALRVANVILLQQKRPYSEAGSAARNVR